MKIVDIEQEKLINHLMDLVFNVEKKRLPKNRIYENYLATDDWLTSNNDPGFDFALRYLYVKKSFAILSHEFLRALCIVCKDYKLISELAGGVGWLTHWMRQYGINVVDCIDNMSWHHHRDQEYLQHVEKYDAVEYVHEHPEIDLFILSWPNMNTMAMNIWKCMRPGQFLLYIGEPRGGMSGDDEFFDLTRDKLVLSATAKLFSSFISFFGIHDRPYLFRK